MMINMKPFIFTAALLCCMLLSGCGDRKRVYICTGPQSERYHKTDHCKGLRRCSGSIERITISEAHDLGRTPCGYCY